MNNLIKLTDNFGKEFWATKAQSNAIDKLNSAGHGRFISVLGYKPTTGYSKAPTVDYTLLSKFSTTRLYERKVKALNNISFDDVCKLAKDDEKLSKLENSKLKDIFQTRLNKEIESLAKSIDGTLSNAHTRGHDRNYAKFDNGIVVNFKTEKEDGVQTPILTDGLPTAETILVTGLTIQKKVIIEGERKVVNSGAPVRVSNIIKRLLNERSVGLKRFSLKPDNFSEIRLDSGVILNESLQDLAE
jgi:hypothetical protein